jgi:hypothetical protein
MDLPTEPTGFMLQRVITPIKEAASKGVAPSTMELALGKKVARSSEYKKALLQSRVYWGQVSRTALRGIEGPEVLRRTPAFGSSTGSMSRTRTCC